MEATLILKILFLLLLLLLLLLFMMIIIFVLISVKHHFKSAFRAGSCRSTGLWEMRLFCMNRWSCGGSKQVEAEGLAISYPTFLCLVTCDWSFPFFFLQPSSWVPRDLRIYLKIGVTCTWAKSCRGTWIDFHASCWNLSCRCCFGAWALM